MVFNFNLFSGLLLPPFLHGVLFACLLFIRGNKEEKLSDILLAWLLLLSSIKISFWMLGFAGWFDTHDGFSTFMFYFPFSNTLWMGPLLYFYFLSLTNADFKFTKAHWRHLILPLLYLLLVVLKCLADFLFHYPFADTIQSHYATKGPWADVLNDNIVDAVAYTSFIYYLVLTMKAYKKYQAYIHQNFSSTDFIEFSWIRNILYSSAFGTFVFLAFEIASLLTNNGGYVFYWYPYLALGVVVYYISIAGYQSGDRTLHQLHFQPENPVLAPEVPTPAAVDNGDSLKTDLLVYMTNVKPYLDPELNLSSLAAAVNLPAAVLSRLINEKFDVNFNDFINDFRVKEVIAKLKAGEHKKQTLLGIALDAGFNSKATFNRAFKKSTSLSPKEWVTNNFPKQDSPE